MAKDGHAIGKRYLSTTPAGPFMVLQLYTVLNLSKPSLLTTKSGDIIIPILEENYRGQGEVRKKARLKCFVKCKVMCKC